VNSLDAKNSGQVVLITGAGGCIGSALAHSLIHSGAKLAVLLDHSEQNLYEVHSQLSAATDSPVHVPVLGDISDQALLDELLEKYHPDSILHAAAFKHVPLMEANPLAVMRNNILGTWTLANAALQHGIGQLLMVSTDKAVNPRSVMGAAKRIAELILLRLGDAQTPMSALRLGNVLGSNGSVVPLFKQQIARGGPVTVTHPDSFRYFLSLGETVKLIHATAALNETGIFVPKLGAPVRIIDLAHDLIAAAGQRPHEIEITFTGLRPGDKLTEDLVSSTEWPQSTASAKLQKINGPRPSAKALDTAIQILSEGLRTRNLAVLVETLCELVPEYQPSEALLSLLNEQVIVGAQHRCAPNAQP
jgi:FlaA1/EpsC-like NDP-sugar epimerase